MRIRFRGGNPFGFLAARSKKERYLAEYVLREHGRGRPLTEVFEDPYVRNRSTPEERARLLDRPEFVEAVGSGAVERLRREVAVGARS